MATGQLETLVRYLRRAAAASREPAASDGQLLERFRSRRDGAAFELLVCRHGAAVWGVCRRVLADAHAAEDAFQATFLVLLRKAGTIRRGEGLGAWLHRVAWRVALRARGAAARRERVGLDADHLPAAPSGESGAEDLAAALAEEVGRLPEQYRVPVVLCYLEGATYDEAARRLGCPKGTLSTRLTRARQLLRARLARRGLFVSAGALACGLSAQAAAPDALVQAVVRAAGRGPAGLSTRAVTLAEGVMHAMFLTKLKLAAAALVCAALVTTAGTLGFTVLAADEPAKAAADGPNALERLRRDNVRLKSRLDLSEQENAWLRQDLARLRRPAERDGVLGRIKYRIPFRTRRPQFKDGARIDIAEVWGTRPRIEVGGQYLVRGKYVLPAAETGTLYFHLTASNWDNSGPDFDLQHTAVRKGQGDFALLHAMGGPGEFHLTLVGRDTTVADVYFLDAGAGAKGRPAEAGLDFFPPARALVEKQLRRQQK